MKLDEYQQAVVDCGTNAVVSAGAGSGKTTVLSQRFLRLILEGRADVSEILTLTFTRKAAAEMYERIYSLLVEHRDNPAAAAAVNDFDKASISTLDSFCSRIARDCSGMFGLPSNFTTDESSVGALAEDVSLDFILANSDNKHLQDFIYINGFENVWHNFFVHIALNYLALGDPADFNEVFENQMHTASEALAQSVQRADSIAAEIQAIEPVAKSIANAHEALADCRPLSDAAGSGDYAGVRKAASAVKLRKPGKAAKPEIILLKDLVEELREVLPLAAEVAGTLENRELIRGLFELTGDFQQQLFSRKRTAGLLGFHDVLTIAVAGLKRDKELRRFYKSRFRCIMIDEFQDNNGLQKELLYLLAEDDSVEGEGVPDAAGLNPEKLFFVGDEKQSIYRFRGADVSVFKQLSSELTAAGGQSLVLKRNYRSEPGLIDFFNSVFESVMSDSSEAYEAGFEPLESRPAALSAPADIRLLYKPYDRNLPDDSMTAEESEAAAIAEYIEASVGSLEVSDSGTARPAKYSDFAILFRSGTNQKTYEQVLRAQGIPYNVHSVRSLFQEAPVNDIYNFLQIMLYPADRTASAAFLRSPLVNISDISFVRFMLAEKPVFADGMEECCADETDAGKYLRARALYEEILPRLDREPLAGIITDIWYKSGYRYLLLSKSSLHGYLEYYDYLRQLAVKHDKENKSAAEFLDYVRSNLGEYKKIDDLKIMGYSTAGVEMMPVHQSKGLEFPVVIIANAGNVGVNDKGGSTPAFISETDGLSFNLTSVSDDSSPDKGRFNYFYSRGKKENRLRDEAELRRLLYVALTRAECHLVVSGCHGVNNRSGERSMLNMFLRAFGWADQSNPSEIPELVPYLDEIRNRTWSADGGLKASRRANIPAVSQLYASAEPESFTFRKNEFTATELNALHRSEEPQGGESPGIRELPQLDSRLEKLLTEKGYEADFGTLSHRLIEWCIKEEAWEPFPETDELSLQLRPFFPAISNDDWELMIGEAAGLAKGFFSTETWKSASASIGFESETAFTAVTESGGEEIYINGVMDLVFELEDHVGIIDFKTDRRIVPGEYDRQLAIYAEAAESIFSKPVRCSLFYLRGGIEVDAGTGAGE